MAAGGIAPSKVAESVSGGRRNATGETRLRPAARRFFLCLERGGCKVSDAADGWKMMLENPGIRAAPAAGGRGMAAGWAFDCAALVALALASSLVGCLVNALREERLPWVYAGRAKTLDAAVAALAADGSPAPKASEPPQEIRLEEFQVFVMERKGLVLDARPKVFYDPAHVPGAVSLPREDFAEAYPRLRGKLAAYKDQPVAVYCSGADCPDAQLLSDALAKLGYRHLSIYTAGWEEWSQTGLPQEGSAAQP